MRSTLHIQASVQENVTFLKRAYCTTPFKVANITENKRGRLLQLMLMSSSPGILDGDEYEVTIELGEGSLLQLFTQSYQRLFSMKQTASQHVHVHLAKGASFQYLPHPTVPHKQSSFFAINKIYLEENCTLIFGEILTCGRKLNGEVFSFTKYHNLTEVYLKDKLVIKENFLIQPSAVNMNAIGQLEGYSHQGSLIYLSRHCNVKEDSKAVIELLEIEIEMVFGISETPVPGLIIRLLGQRAEQLHDCMKRIASLLSNEAIPKPT